MVLVAGASYKALDGVRTATCVAGLRPMQGRSLLHAARRRHQAPGRRLAAKQDDDDVEATPDWEAEMSLFKKRKSKPNQLSTLRRVLETPDTGKVLYAEDSLAIVEGLVNDAPVGAVLQFSSGARGVLLWRRSDNVCFGLVHDRQEVAAGDAVECTISGILQVVDEAEGPQTKREFELHSVPVGHYLEGRVVDYLCRPLEGQLDLGDAREAGGGSSHQQPTANGAGAPDAQQQQGEQQQGEQRVLLFNSQPDMERREQINEPLLTGVMALDTLTPLGRGQALMVTGPAGGGQHETAIDCILGQRGTGVRCVYAAVGKSRGYVARLLATLREEGALEYTTVVAAFDDAPIGERYAALCAACSAGEASRDAGGHSLVVLDDASVMATLWERITCALAGLGLKAMQLQEGDSDAVQEGGEEALVEYEGMLVSAAAAQRRRFFGSVIQRAAKMSRRMGGGTMTLLPLLLGRPATGEGEKARDAVLQYKHLSEEQKSKLMAALERKQAAADASSPSPSQSSLSSLDSEEHAGKGAAAAPSRRADEGVEVRTEVVEEWMSITDGQVVQRAVGSIGSSSSSGGGSSSGAAPSGQEQQQRGEGVQEGLYCVDPAASISRIGSRAYHQAVEQLAPKIRLELAQAADARRFAADPGDPVVAKKEGHAARVAAALVHAPRSVRSLEEQVVVLYALQHGFVDALGDAQGVRAALEGLVSTLRSADPGLLSSIARSGQLSEADEARLRSQLEVTCTLLRSCEVPAQ